MKKWSSTGIIAGVFGTVIGLGFILTGWSMRTSDDVMCGSEVMYSGDRCVSTMNGEQVGEEKPIGGQRSANRREGLFMMLVGTGVAIGGACKLVIDPKPSPPVSGATWRSERHHHGVAAASALFPSAEPPARGSVACMAADAPRRSGPTAPAAVTRIRHCRLPVGR